MNTRRRLVQACLASALGAAFPALAQGYKPKSGRIPRIGYLILQSIAESPSRERQAFLDGLRELGYVPGRNIEIVYASAEGDEDFLEGAAKDLLRKNVDLIVTAGAQASLAAHSTTRAIPIITLALGDPVGIGLVKSLARPGGNVTGISFISTDLAGKRMQLLKEIVPGARRVVVLWNPRNPNAAAERKAAVAAAKSLGFTVRETAAGSGAQMDEALTALSAAKPDALYVAFDGGLIAERRGVLIQYGLTQRIPVVSGWTFMTEGGGLFSYAPDIPAIFRRSASYVHRVLGGTPAGELPVEMPTKVEFVVNLKTAKSIGVHIPQSILLRADRLVE